MQQSTYILVLITFYSKLLVLSKNIKTVRFFQKFIENTIINV